MADRNPLEVLFSREELVCYFGGKDGAIDVERIPVSLYTSFRNFANKRRKELATKYHPDRSNGEVPGAMSRQYMPEVNNAYDAIEKANEEQLRTYVINFVQGNDPTLIRAAAVIDDLEAKIREREQRLKDAERVIMQFSRARGADDIVLYEDRTRGIRLTLDNYVTELPRLLKDAQAGSAERLRKAQEEVKKYKSEAGRHKEERDTYKAEAAQEKERVKAAQARFAQERRTLEEQVQAVQQELNYTVTAADRALAEQRAQYEKRIIEAKKEGQQDAVKAGEEALQRIQDEYARNLLALETRTLALEAACAAEVDARMRR